MFVDTQSILKPLLSGMATLPNVEQQVAIMSRTLLSRPNVERVMRMVDLDVRATTPREHEQQVDQLMAKLKISGTSTYDIYTITYNNKNPKLVRDVVQSLLTIFVEGSFKGKKGDSQKAVQFIDEQIKSVEERLVATENAVKEFKMRNSALLPRQGIDYGAQLALAADALNTARLELAEAEQARRAIKAQVSGDEPVPALELRPAAILNPELDARISTINKNLDNMRMQYTEQHPDIVAARRLVAQLEARKLEESRNRGADADPGRNYSPMLQQLKVALTEADAKVAGDPGAGAGIQRAPRTPARAEQRGAGSRVAAGPAEPRLPDQQGQLREADRPARGGQAVGRTQFDHRDDDLQDHRPADHAGGAGRPEPAAAAQRGAARRRWCPGRRWPGSSARPGPPSTAPAPCAR